MRGVDPKVAALYRRFERMVRDCGEVLVSPTKTMVVFKARATFASVAFRKDGLRVGIMLARRLASPRIVKVETVSPHSHAHVFIVRVPEDLDPEVRSWLREAYGTSIARHPAR